MEVFDSSHCGIFTEQCISKCSSINATDTQYFHLIVTAFVSVVGKEKNHDDYDTKMIVYCATSFVLYILQEKRPKTISCFWILPSLL